MAVGKRVRFEVFKRDGFRCVYCGATPMSSALEVDHVIPSSKGGSDDAANLITACVSCNSGKSNVALEQKALRPNVATEADEDHVEQIKAFLRLQKKVAKAKAAVTDEIIAYWRERIGTDPSDSMRPRFGKLAEEFGFARLFEAIDIIAARGPKGQDDQARYFHGILRHWRDEEGR